MSGMLTAHEAPLVLTQNWGRFLDKLSIPVTQERCGRHLPAPPPCGLRRDVHGTAANADPQRRPGDNLLVAEDGEPALAVVDWQLTTGARPASDLARFLVGSALTGTLPQAALDVLIERIDTHRRGGARQHPLPHCGPQPGLRGLTAARLGPGIRLAGTSRRPAAAALR